MDAKDDSRSALRVRNSPAEHLTNISKSEDELGNDSSLYYIDFNQISQSRRHLCDVATLRLMRFTTSVCSVLTTIFVTLV